RRSAPFILATLPFRCQPARRPPSRRSSFPLLSPPTAGPSDAAPLVGRPPAFHLPLFQVALQLALHPLQRVVDGFHMTAQLVGNLLIRLAFQIVHEDVPFQLAEELLH